VGPGTGNCKKAKRSLHFVGQMKKGRAVGKRWWERVTGARRGGRGEKWEGRKVVAKGGISVEGPGKKLGDQLGGGGGNLRPAWG